MPLEGFLSDTPDRSAVFGLRSRIELVCSQRAVVRRVFHFYFLYFVWSYVLSKQTDRAWQFGFSYMRMPTIENDSVVCIRDVFIALAVYGVQEHITGNIVNCCKLHSHPPKTPREVDVRL